MTSAAVIAVAASLGSILFLVLTGLLVFCLLQWQKKHLLQQLESSKSKDIEISAAQKRKVSPVFVTDQHAVDRRPSLLFKPGQRVSSGAQIDRPGPVPVPAGPGLQRQSPRAVLQQSQAAQTQLANVRLQQWSVLASGKVSLSVQIQQEGMRVLAVEVREFQTGSGAQLVPFWRPLSNLQADVWELLSFRLRQPFDMRITSSAGKQAFIRDVMTEFRQQQLQDPTPGAAMIRVSFSSPVAAGTADLSASQHAAATVAQIQSESPMAPSVLRPDVSLAIAPSGAEAIADPLWRTSDTLDMPGYDCDPARLDAELEAALATHHELGPGDPQALYSSMSRISKELEDVDSNPSDIVLTAQSMAPFFDTQHEPSSQMR